MSIPSRVALVTTIVLLCGLPCWPALGQEEERRVLDISLDYSYGPSDRVIEEFGTEVEPIDYISSHSLVFSVNYSPIEKLQLQAAIPLITTIYYGDGSAFPAHGLYDDGNYHTVLQDFRLSGSYTVIEEPVIVTPHLGVSVPMTNYETVGYAGAGRGLNRLHMGFSVTKLFTSGIPNLYVYGLYEYSLAERYKTAFAVTEEYNQDKSDIKFLTGYFLGEKLEFNLAADLQLAHGGLHFSEWEESPRVVQLHHDALLAESFLLLGGGVSYQLTEAVRLSALLRLWVWGENTRDVTLIGGGVSWSIL